MIKCKLDDEMVIMLKSIIGSELNSFEFDDDKFVEDRAFGLIRVNTSCMSIDIYNEVHGVDYFGDCEDISYFTCCVVDSGEKFNGYFEKSSIKKRIVDEKILGIQIVSDTIRIDVRNYYIEFDIGIIFRTKNNCYMISRDWHFMETMQLTCNKDIDEVVSIGTVIDNWNNDGELEVKVERVVREL